MFQIVDLLQSTEFISTEINLKFMKIRFLIILFSIFFIQLPAEAKKKRHSNHKRSYARSNRKHKTPHSTFVPIQVSTDGEIWGLDVSHHQQNIDWETLGQHQPSFVFLKTTEGATKQDEKYVENYQGARNNNIPVGSYHFFTYKSSGKEQALNFLSRVKFNKGDLPPVLDLEFSRRMPPVDQVKSELMDFISIVSNKMACFPIVYCNYRYFNKYLHECLPEKCKLWIVDYKAKPDGNWTFWQTSDKHKVPGIKGYVDLNIYNGTKNNFAGLLN